MRAREDPGEERAAVEDRNVRRHDHVARRHDTLVGGDAAGRVVAGIEHAGLLEYEASVPGDRLGDRQEVFPRMELRLIVEADGARDGVGEARSEEHTSELQSLMRLSYAVLCLKKKQKHTQTDKRPITRT